MRLWPWGGAAHKKPSGEAAQTTRTGAGIGDDSLLVALQQQERHTLVYFNSNRCTLCRTLAPSVSQAQHQHASWLAVATVCTDDQARWAPEMLHYGVESVPCFVLLKPGGHAIAKSGRPRGRPHMTRSLDALLQLGASAVTR